MAYLKYTTLKFTLLLKLQYFSSEMLSHNIPTWLTYLLCHFDTNIYFVTIYNDIHKNIHFILEAIFIFTHENLLE